MENQEILEILRQVQDGRMEAEKAARCLNGRERERIILVLDGQGGGMGAQIVRMLRAELPEDCRLVCVGTNVLATNAMLKAGAGRGATGENALIFHAAQADIILGPLGLILANGIFGEVSPAMATAVSGAKALKILIPFNTCGVQLTGAGNLRLEEHLRQAVDLVKKELCV